VPEQVGDVQAEDHVETEPKSKAKASSKKQKKVQVADVQVEGGLVLGCAKCRRSPTGCSQCRDPSFKGKRGPLV
jgi:hypothetical protein